MKQFFKICLIACALFAIASAKAPAQCTVNSDCSSMYYCESGSCVHSIFPLQPLEIGGLVLTVIITGLASAGGNGGGTILTPILLIFFHYSESNAIMVVYSMIFGGAVGNFINTGIKKSPKTGKPYLNYDLSLICMPPMLLGNAVGIIMNRVVAPIVVVVGLLALTTYTLIRITSKARSEYAKETITKREQNKLLAEEGLINSFSETTDADTTYDEIDNSRNDETKLFQPVKIAKNVGILGFMILLYMFRGSQNFGSIIGIPYCGVAYWMCLAVACVVCGIVFYFNQRSVKATIKEKQARRFHSFTKDEFELKDSHIGKLFVLSLIAGVLAGMFGIGGGTVMSPTLLGLGVKAHSLSATSGFFVLQTSFMSLIAAILYGEIPIREMGFFLGVACIGSFGVSYIISKFVKRYQRPSIILFSLIFVYILSFFATPIYEFLTNMNDLDNLFVFNDFC